MVRLIGYASVIVARRPMLDVEALDKEDLRDADVPKKNIESKVSLNMAAMEHDSIEFGMI